MSDFARRSPEHESLAAEWGLLKIELHHCKKQLKEARTIACKLLYIAEHRGPKVFGPRPPWLKPNPDG